MSNVLITIIELTATFRAFTVDRLCRFSRLLLLFFERHSFGQTFGITTTTGKFQIIDMVICGIKINMMHCYLVYTQFPITSYPEEPLDFYATVLTIMWPFTVVIVGYAHVFIHNAFPISRRMCACRSTNHFYISGPCYIFYFFLTGSSKLSCSFMTLIRPIYPMVSFRSSRQDYLTRVKSTFVGRN